MGGPGRAGGQGPSPARCRWGRGGAGKGTLMGEEELRPPWRVGALSAMAARELEAEELRPSMAARELEAEELRPSMVTRELLPAMAEGHDGGRRPLVAMGVGEEAVMEKTGKGGGRR